ncbi:hypothetical protein BX592_11075 [Paraburkholderia rhizosphaerae]|uniref:Uncharacterized protein n=1 Tax=Paraburkholderia rhizosphaerae TaxID=480658 RepID=A0A4R8LRV2_9BURK|nr:hypothetical protein BX592_11075 [Paraburkholderia rhizosphaerae]
MPAITRSLAGSVAPFITAQQNACHMHGARHIGVPSQPSCGATCDAEARR